MSFDNIKSVLFIYHGLVAQWISIHAFNRSVWCQLNGNNWMKKFQGQPESQRKFLKSIISKLTTMYIVLLLINSIIIIIIHVHV